MKPAAALEVLWLLYTRPENLTEELEKWTRYHKNQILWILHAPLLFFLIPFLALCPFAFYASLFSAQYFIQPLLMIAFGLLMANSHDYAEYFFSSPVGESASETQVPHFSLLAHLCMAGSFPFFLLHPGLGMGVLLLNIGYAQFLSVDLHARHYRRSRARIWGHLFMSISFLLLPILAIVLILNFWHNLRYLFFLFL